MQGRRVYEFDDPIETEPGDYFFWEKAGYWMARVPNGDFANLSGHEIIEHEDGTITVRPSILVWGAGREWHGYLVDGVWSEV